MGLTLIFMLLVGGISSFANQPNKPKPIGTTINQDIGFLEKLFYGIFGGPKTGSGYNNPHEPGGGNWSGGPTAPIDGGISLLLAAGIGLGVKKMANRKALRQKSAEVPE